MDQTRVTAAVVDFIIGTGRDGIPADAIGLGKRCAIDGLGVILAGSTTEGSSILRDYFSRPAARTRRPSSAAEPFRGSARPRPRLPTAPAATRWISTTRSSRRRPDRIFGLLTHPTLPPLAAALALGERRRASGADAARGVSHRVRGRVQDCRSDPSESLQERLSLLRHRSGRLAPWPPRRSCSASTRRRWRTRSPSPRACAPASASTSAP